MNRLHTVSLEWAKKLTTAKIVGTSAYRWYSFDNEQWQNSFTVQIVPQALFPKTQHPAYLATELLNILPKTLKTFGKSDVDEILTEEDGWLGYPFNIEIDIDHSKEIYWVGYLKNKDYLVHTQNENLCDALAELAVWCKKHKYI